MAATSSEQQEEEEGSGRWGEGGEFAIVLYSIIIWVSPLISLKNHSTCWVRGITQFNRAYTQVRMYRISALMRLTSEVNSDVALAPSWLQYESASFWCFQMMLWCNEFFPEVLWRSAIKYTVLLPLLLLTWVFQSYFPNVRTHPPPPPRCCCYFFLSSGVREMHPCAIKNKKSGGGGVCREPRKYMELPVASTCASRYGAKRN